MAGWSLVSVVLAVLTAGGVAWGLSKLIPTLLFYRHANKQLRRLPHHKPVHWLLGNIPQIGSPEGFMVLYMKLMKEYGRAFTIWFAHHPILMVCHPDTMREAIKKTEIKPRGYDLVKPWIGDGLLLASGEKWERNRKLLTPAFHFDILKPYVRLYQEAAQVCADQLSRLAGGGDGKSLMDEGGGGKSVEICEPLGLLTLDIMLTCALSFKTDLQIKGHPYEKAVGRLMQLVMKRSLNPAYMLSDTIWWMSPPGREFRSLCDYAHNVSGNIIRTRQDQLKNDLGSIKKRHLDFLDILLTAKDESGLGLTFQEIRDEVDTFLFEGHDTTKAGLSWSIYCLAKYPEEQEKVLAEVRQVFGDREHLEWEDLQRLNYMTLFVKEVTRLYPPAPQVARQTTAPVTIGGVDLPPGVQVELLIYAMHHNPLVWPDPEKFDPNRFKLENFADHDPFSYVPFSAGQRNCIGQVFALNEVKTVLACLLRRFEFGFDEDHEKNIILQPLATLKSKNGIKVKVRER